MDGRRSEDRKSQEREDEMKKVENINNGLHRLQPPACTAVCFPFTSVSSCVPLGSESRYYKLPIGSVIRDAATSQNFKS